MKQACEKMSQLASMQFERKLSFGEKASMKFHFFMCSACRSYNENMVKLHQALRLSVAQEIKGLELPKDKRIAIEQLLHGLDKSAN